MIPTLTFSGGAAGPATSGAAGSDSSGWTVSRGGATAGGGCVAWLPWLIAGALALYLIRKGR